MQGDFSLHHIVTSDCSQTSRNVKTSLITLGKRNTASLINCEKPVFKEMIFYTATNRWRQSQTMEADFYSTVVSKSVEDEGMSCCEQKTISLMHFHSQASSNVDHKWCDCGSSCAASVVNGAGNEMRVALLTLQTSEQGSAKATWEIRKISPEHFGNK